LNYIFNESYHCYFMNTLILDLYIFLIKFLFELGIGTWMNYLILWPWEAHKRDSLVHICLLVENSLCGVEVHYVW
jgi:hypothetical protein